MHELSITKELVRQIKTVSKKNNICKGEALIEIGRLTTYAKEPLIFYYRELIEQDEFFTNKNIKLKLKYISGKLYCNNCGKYSKLGDIFEIVCPACNSFETKITGGNQVILKRIDSIE